MFNHISYYVMILLPSADTIYALLRTPNCLMRKNPDLVFKYFTFTDQPLGEVSTNQMTTCITQKRGKN